MSQLVGEPKSLDWRPGEIPELLQKRLRALRSAIASSLWLEGLARISLIIVAVAVLDFLLDYFFQMDRSQRAIMALLIAGGLGYAVYRYLWLPLSQQASDDALVLSVERKLNLKHNTLINTLQLARQANSNPHYSSVMAQKVVESGLHDVDTVDFRKALNQSRSQKNRWYLILGLASLMCLAVLTLGTGLGRIWLQRNLLLGSEKWPTRTRLVVDGVVDGELVIPRGEDHLLRVQVDPESSITDVDVYVNFQGRSSGTRQKLQADGSQPLQHLTTLRSVNSEFQFRVSGGDFESDQIQVRLVEPPGFEELKISVLPPAYSGLAEQSLPLSVEKYRVLLGSQLKLTGRTDVENVSLALASGSRRLPITVDSQGAFEGILEGDQLQPGRYLLDLQDADGISSNRPMEFSLEVVEDQAPKIRAKSYGVSGVVMNKAVIPVSATLEDEFAVTAIELEFQPGTDPELLKRLPAEEFQDQLGQSELQGETSVDLRQQQVEAGRTLSLTVRARDNQPDDREDSVVWGRSKTMVFEVVTEAEFRADLLRREMEQTKVFEKLIERQEKLLTELNVLLAATPDQTETPESFQARRAQMANQATREQNQIATLLVEISERFRGFLEEVVYNRVDEGLSEEDAGQRIGDRLAQQIVEPLAAIDAQSMPEVLRGMEWVLRSTADDNELARSLQDTVPKGQRVLAEMKEVLNAMQRSQSFQELVNDLLAIKREEERLNKQVEDKKKEDNSIFDDEIFN